MIKKKNKHNEGALDIRYHWTKEGVKVIGYMPPRLTKQQAAELMGVEMADLCGLQKHGLLYPMGHAPKKGRTPFKTCYYASSELLNILGDGEWWDEAQHAISQYNNDRRGGKIKVG
jgi:hypothetical protein